MEHVAQCLNIQNTSPFDGAEVLFRTIMDDEQNKLEVKMRELLLSFEKKSGRTIWIKFSEKNDTLFTIERFFVSDNEAKAAIEHYHTNPQLYHL